MEHKTIASKLKAYRLKRLWTLKRMAEESGMTLQAIWLIENGKVKPHERTIARLNRLPGFGAARG